MGRGRARGGGGVNRGKVAAALVALAVLLGFLAFGSPPQRRAAGDVAWSVLLVGVLPLLLFGGGLLLDARPAVLGATVFLVVFVLGSISLDDTLLAPVLLAVAVLVGSRRIVRKRMGAQGADRDLLGIGAGAGIALLIFSVCVILLAGAFP